MVIQSVKKQILADLARMTPEIQRRAADLVHGLVPSSRKGTAGHVLLRFAGTIDPASAKEMSDAISAGCGRIELDEW